MSIESMRQLAAKQAKSEPFDQDLFDRTMASQRQDHEPDDYTFFYNDGFRAAATIAARIAAERVTKPAYCEQDDPGLQAAREAKAAQEWPAEPVPLRCEHGYGDDPCPICDGVAPDAVAVSEVTDEMLRYVYHEGYGEYADAHADAQGMYDTHDAQAAGYRAILALAAEQSAVAVRAALGPAVPVIPEGWVAGSIYLGNHGWTAFLHRGSRGELGRSHVTGRGENPNDALTAAIDAAKENDHE